MTSTCSSGASVLLLHNVFNKIITLFKDIRSAFDIDNFLTPLRFCFQQQDGTPSKGYTHKRLFFFMLQSLLIIAAHNFKCTEVDQTDVLKQKPSSLCFPLRYELRNL